MPLVPPDERRMKLRFPQGLKLAFKIKPSAKKLEISVNEKVLISKEVGVSRVQLFRKLKNLAGLSPADFIKDLRMKKAAQLLRTQNVKVAEVAYEVGFQDVEYFSKCFKKAYNINPSKLILERKEALN